MSTNFRFLGFVFLLSGQILCQNAFAELQAFVDRSTILESQTIEFTLRASRQGDPDFSVLEKHFRILGSRTNSQYKSINGRVSSWIDWNLTLEPKITGELTIPAIKLNAESSSPITIQVNALDPDLRAAIQSLVFFETDVSAESVYVQAQLVFTRKLYYARGAQLYGETPGTPEIKNAVVRTIKAVAPVSVDIAGRAYTLLEQKYAIFPERSGKLIIPAAAASGNVRLRAQPGFVGGRTRIRAVSQALEITVKPIPASYPVSQPWLPASEVNMVDAWSEHSVNMLVGVPVTRVIIVQAQASIGSIIPPLQPAFPKALRAYPQAPEISEHSIPGGLTGLRKEEYSISAQRTGSIRLPEIALTWWDTDTDEVKVSRVPEHTIQVALNPAAPGALTGDETTSFSVPEPSMQPEQILPETEGGNLEDNFDTLPFSLTQFSMLVVFIILLFLSIRYLPLREFLRKVIARNPETALERKLFIELESSAHNIDLRLFKSQLTEWLSVFYQLPLNKALQTLDRDEPSRQLMHELNRGIYASVADNVDQARLRTELMQLVKQHRESRSARQTAANKHRNALPELFPVGSH